MEAREVMVTALSKAVREIGRALKELEELPLGVYKEIVFLGELELPPIRLSMDRELRARLWFFQDFYQNNGKPAVRKEVLIDTPSRTFTGTEFPSGERIVQFILPEHPSKVLEVVRGLEGWAEELRRLIREAGEKYARALEEEGEALDELRARAALKGLGEA